MVLVILHANDIRARTFGNVKKSSAVEILYDAIGLELIGDIALCAFAVVNTSQVVNAI